MTIVNYTPARWTESGLRVLEERYLWKKDGQFLEDPDGLCVRVGRAVAEGERSFLEEGPHDDERATREANDMATWDEHARDHFDAYLSALERQDDEGVAQWAARFTDLLMSGKFLPNSPTLMNAGKGNGLQLSACFVLPVEDSIEGIFDTIKHCAIIHKSGGGTGMSFSRLRPAGATVGTSQGVASGPVSFLKIFDTATEQIKQGGTRRGANMAILSVQHPDIEAFIRCKMPVGVLQKPTGAPEIVYPITNFNISVGITDAFMAALAIDEEYDLIDPHTQAVTARRSARAVWDLIVECAWQTGDPGLVFLDRINTSRANPIPAIEQIEATNPCVTGDTLVYTERGLLPIAQLVNEGIPTVVDPRIHGFDTVYAARSTASWETGVKRVYRLTTIEGYELRLTADHRVMTDRGWVEAQHLTNEDRIHILKGGGASFGAAGTEGEGRVVGWLIGDGTITTQDKEKGIFRACLDFWGDDRELAPTFAQYVSAMTPNNPGNPIVRTIGVRELDARDRSQVASSRLAQVVARDYGMTGSNKVAGLPVQAFGLAKTFQRGLLQSLFTADGTVTGTADKGVSVRLTSVSMPLLRDTQRMLLAFGIASRIYENRHAAREITINGKAAQAHADHDLVIGKDNVLRFQEAIGFLSAPKRDALVRALATYGKRGPYREQFTARLKELVFVGEEMVYDLSQPDHHSFIANGIVVHNCGEQPIFSNDLCNLGSINLGLFLRKETPSGHYFSGFAGKALVTPGVYSGRLPAWCTLGPIAEKYLSFDWDAFIAAVHLATRFLDNVIEINQFPLPQIRERAHQLRRIGLGVMGFHDLLMLLGIPYDSTEAMALGREIMRVLNTEAIRESERLATERGSFLAQSVSRYKEDAPRRNSNLTTVAPTGTISILGNCSSGIEPVFALTMFHSVKQSDDSWRILKVANAAFEAVARHEGFWSADLEQHVIATGSVQGRADVPARWQRVFLNAQEIHPHDHVRMQAAWQEHNDSGISKSVNAPNSFTRDELSETYLLAYATGCLGTTIYRDGCKQNQVLTVGEGAKNYAIPAGDAPLTLAAPADDHACPECDEQMVDDGGCVSCPACGYSHCNIVPVA